MRYRLASVLASEAANTAGTKTIDLTGSKPISRILIQVKATNNGHVPTAHPAKIVSKIELVDGSQPLFSLSGIECQALNFYETGRLPHGLMSYCNDVMAAATFELNFGRYLWDNQYAFDPTKYTNPQLKITHNLAAGGSAPDAMTLSVFSFDFDENEAKPIGFLMSKEQYNYTISASAAEHIDLATDLPYRGLMILSLAAGYQPFTQYNKIKLSENNDQRVLINNESTSDLIKMLGDLPRIVEAIMAADLDGEETIYCTPSYLEAVVGQGMGAADTALFADQGYGGAFDATGTADAFSQWIVTGFLPHGALWLPFGQKDDPADWYDVTKVGNLKLTITAGAGAGTTQIVSQQLKLYA